MSDLIDRFDAEHNAYNDITKDRRVESRRVLEEFERFCGGDLLTAEPDNLRAYINHVTEQGFSLGTLRKRVGLIRPFYTWAWEHKLATSEQVMGLKLVRLPRGTGATAQGTPRPYKRDEIHRLWRDLDKQFPLATDRSLQAFASGTRWRGPVRKHGMRLQVECVLALTLFGGIRQDEVWRLTLEQMDPLNAYVTVHGAAKNDDGERRIRAVPWTTPDMKRMVGNWLEFRAWLEPEHDWPWLSLWNTPQYRWPLRKRRFKGLLSGLGRGYSFHRMRHTAITEMLRAGYPIQEVQKIAGHARITQTLAYAQILPDDLLKTAARQSDELSSALSPRIAA